MGYDILIYPAKQLLNGEINRVKGETRYVERIRIIDTILSDFSRFALDINSPEFDWWQSTEAGTVCDNDGIPKGDIYDPVSVKNSLLKIRSLIVETPYNHYIFKTLMPDSRMLTVTTDFLIVDTKIERWQLIIKNCKCLGYQLVNGAIKQEVDFAAKYGNEGEILEGYAIDGNSLTEIGIESFMKKRKREDKRKDIIFFSTSIDTTTALEHVDYIIEVCDYSIKNNYLLNIIHSY